MIGSETRQELRARFEWFVRSARKIEKRANDEARPLTPKEMREWDAYIDDAGDTKKRMKMARDELQDRDPQRTAIHEAGHAVACVLEGVSVRAAELRGPEWDGDPDLRRLLGVVFHGKTARGGPRWAASLLGGLAAEGIAGNRPAGPDPEFRQVAHEIGEDAALEEFRHVRRRLRENWPAVEKVADILRRDGSVPGSTVAEIVKAEAVKRETLTGAGIAARRAELQRRRGQS